MWSSFCVRYTLDLTMSSISFSQIVDQELEVRNCKSLLHLNADELALHQLSEDNTSSSDSEQHVILAEKLKLAESLEYNSTASKLEIENIHLAEQLHRFGFLVETILAFHRITHM